MKIEKYEIEMLDVKSADAFIIHIVDENDADHIILVDAGNYNDGQKIIDHLRKYYISPRIDLAIVTHPDDDHYGGFFYLLEKIKNNIKDKIEIVQFWIHDPGQHISVEDLKYKWKNDNAKTEARSVLNLNGENLLQIVDDLGIARLEPFARYEDDTIFGHPDFMIVALGPTEDYYKSLVPNFRNSLKPKYDSEESDEDSTVTLKEGKIYSKTLDEAGDDPSTHNQSSLIFAFLPTNEKKYLFMGDAGEAAFTNIPKEFQDYIRNVQWLKVPHHGSKYNMSNDMINTIKPKVAYITTEKIGKYLSQSVVNALKKADCSVYSTHKNGSMLHNNIVSRDGYSNAEKL
jgi:beta-lactamase superfamily II metal-dependent hydrolase